MSVVDTSNPCLFHSSYTKEDMGMHVYFIKKIQLHSDTCKVCLNVFLPNSPIPVLAFHTLNPAHSLDSSQQTWDGDYELLSWWFSDDNFWEIEVRL